MAKSKLAEAYVDLRAEGESRVNGTMRRVRKETESTYKKMQQLRLVTAGVFLGNLAFSAAAAGFRVVKQHIGEVIAAAMGGEDAIAKLRATIQSTGNAGRITAEQIGEFADRLKEQTNVDDDVTRSLVSLGLNLGISADQIEEVTRLSIGLAEAMGTNAEAALRSLAKAMGGNFMEFQRSIPALAAMTRNEDKLAEIVRIANGGFQQRTQLTNTLTGATQRLTNAKEDLYKAIGGLLNPALIAAANEGAVLFKTLTAGTLENKVAVLDLTQRYYELLAALRSVYGGDVEGAHRRIEEMNRRIADATNERIRADNDAANQQARGLRMIGEAARFAHVSLTDLFEINSRAAESDPRIIAMIERRAQAEDRLAKARARNEANRPGRAQPMTTAEMTAELRRINDELLQMLGVEKLSDKSNDGTFHRRRKQLRDRATELEDLISGEGNAVKGRRSRSKADRLARYGVYTDPMTLLPSNEIPMTAKVNGSQMTIQVKKEKTPTDDPIVKGLKAIEEHLKRMGGTALYSK